MSPSASTAPAEPSVGHAPRASVVIATFNRWSLLERLLGQLADQTVAPGGYEVVVVDDGSADAVAPRAEALALPYPLRVETQANQGAAAARHRGVLAARGDVLVILDDDMQVGRDFLEQHLTLHEDGAPRVVLGRIAPDEAEGQRPLFERWHQRLLDDMVDSIAQGAPLHGTDLFTGNVSLRRADYLASGGFDAALGHSEDAELGLRLEKAGVQFQFAPRAQSLHGSDHTQFDKWRRRARLYGQFDHRIGQKHRGLPQANPWRFFVKLNPLARPFMLAAVAAPKLSSLLSRAVYGAAWAADKVGLSRGAIAGTTLSYGLEYFGGLRDDAGTLPGTLAELAAYLLRSPGPDAGLSRRALQQFLDEVDADFETLLEYQAKYDERPADVHGPSDAFVKKIGFQLLVAYRLMRAFARAERMAAAKLTSRMIRHVYGAEVHWETEVAPGVLVVHGTGLTLSRSARVGHGCILFHNVTLGIGTDPATREVGAPTLEDGVHVGPGATLVGPITVGRGSKIMAGVVLTESVPPGSLVESPSPRVGPRVTRRPAVDRGGTLRGPGALVDED
jgi:serine acetyltransferase/GT2 family glycosyltransferase